MLTASWLADIKAQKDAATKQEEQRQALLATQIQQAATQWDPVVRGLLRELGEATWGIPLVCRTFGIEFWNRAKEPTGVKWYGDHRFDRKGRPTGDHWDFKAERRSWLGWRLWHKEDRESARVHLCYEVWVEFATDGTPEAFSVNHEARTTAEVTESSLKELLRKAYLKGPFEDAMQWLR